MNTLRDELEQTDRRRATTRIRDAVENLTVTPNAGDADTTSVREKWISSELYHALTYEFRDQAYQIRQEYSLGRSSVDLLVEHESEPRRYPIEIKRAGHHSSRERALTQIRRYRKRTNGCRRAFLVMIVENTRDLPENKESVKDVVDEINDETDTEVLLKPPTDLLYTET